MAPPGSPAPPFYFKNYSNIPRREDFTVESFTYTRVLPGIPSAAHSGSYPGVARKNDTSAGFRIFEITIYDFLFFFFFRFMSRERLVVCSRMEGTMGSFFVSDLEEMLIIVDTVTFNMLAILIIGFMILWSGLFGSSD